MRTIHQQMLFTSFLFLFILHLATCELSTGQYSPPFLPLGDPTVNVDDIFKAQPVRRPSPGIIRRVSEYQARACDRYYEWYKNKTGVASMSLLSCCLFGSKSGFCKPELFPLQPAGNFLCNNDTQRAPREERHKKQPIGQCCVFKRGNDEFEYECMEDQTWRKCDCAGRDDRCQVKNVECDCLAEYRKPKFRSVSKYMKAGVRLIAHKCRAQRKALQAVADAISCCGITVQDRSYCLFYQSIGYGNC